MFVVRIVILTFCGFLVAGAVSAQGLEARVRPVRVGDMQVTGFVLPAQTNAADFVIEVYEAAAGARRFIDRKAIPRFETTGEFAVTLSRAAAADQRIELTRRGTLVPGGMVDVLPATPVPPPAPMVTAQLSAASVGDQRVSGRVLPPQGNASGFFVEIDDGAVMPRFVARYAITAFDTTGTFAITLAAALNANERAHVMRGGTTLDTIGVPAPTPPQFRFLPLYPGERVVRGVLSPRPRDTKAMFVEIRRADNQLKGRKAIGELEATTNAFSVTLDDALGSDDTVSVSAAAGKAVTIARFTARPALRDSLYDGTRIVHGRVDPSTGVAGVRVRVLRSALENEFSTAPRASGQALNLLRSARYVQVKGAPVNTFSDLGEFTVTLDAPLVAGQIVVAQAVSGSGESGEESERVTVTDPGSWGRARAYFAGGIVFAKDREDFSKQDLALTLAIDKSVLQKADFTLPADRAVQDAFVQSTEARCIMGSAADQAAREAAEDCRTQARNEARRDPRLRSDGKFTFRQLNTFFDARLTQLPVVEPVTASTPPPSTDAQANGSVTTGFRDSRKGAWMQLGVYAPVYGPQTSWVHEGAVNTVFIAPLYRNGIQTISSDDGTSTKNARGEADDIFHFTGFGFAFGHQKLSGSTNQTPELISYLGIVWGHSEAFEYIDTNLSVERDLKDSSKLFKCETTRTAVNGKVLVDPCRTMIEGRLKIPNTALQIGFNADLGDGHDDLRFIFGTRFDIGEAFARLRNFGF